MGSGEDPSRTLPPPAWQAPGAWREGTGPWGQESRMSRPSKVTLGSGVKLENGFFLGRYFFNQTVNQRVHGYTLCFRIKGGYNSMP